MKSSQILCYVESATPHQQNNRGTPAAAAATTTASEYIFYDSTANTAFSHPRSFALHLLMFLLFSRFKHFWSEISGCDLLFKYTKLEHTACVRIVIGVCCSSLCLILHKHYVMHRIVCDSNFLFRVVGSNAFCSLLLPLKLLHPSLPPCFRHLVLCCCRLQWTLFGWIKFTIQQIFRTRNKTKKNGETSTHSNNNCLID